LWRDARSSEERDIARGKEEELFDTLAAKEEDLTNTNEGYVYLTDQLNEVKEEFEEKVDECERMIENLTDQNKKLLDEGIKLRQDLGEARRKLAEAEKAVQRAEQGLPVTFRVSRTDSKDAAVPDPRGITASPADVDLEESPGKGKDGVYPEDFEDE